MVTDIIAIEILFNIFIITIDVVVSTSNKICTLECKCQNCGFPFPFHLIKTTIL